MKTVHNVNNLLVKDLFAELKMVEICDSKKFGPDGYHGFIFGNQIPTNDPAAAFDDRYFGRSAMRFSPYFKRIKKARENARLYTKMGFYPERYNEEFPMTHGDSEIYCEAELEICDEYKRIFLNCGMEILIYSDGTLYLHNVSGENPELFLTKDAFLPSVELPYCDFLISKGMKPEAVSRVTRIQHFDNNIGVDGGTMSLCFEISSFGNVLSNTGIDLKLRKRTDRNKIDTDIETDGTETEKTGKDKNL